MNTPKLTSRILKEFAARLGAGGGGVEILGVANIERFAEAPERMHRKTSSRTAVRSSRSSSRFRAAPTAASRKEPTGRTTPTIPTTGSTRCSGRC